MRRVLGHLAPLRVRRGRRPGPRSRSRTRQRDDARPRLVGDALRRRSAVATPIRGENPATTRLCGAGGPRAPRYAREVCRQPGRAGERRACSDAPSRSAPLRRDGRCTDAYSGSARTSSRRWDATLPAPGSVALITQRSQARWRTRWCAVQGSTRSQITVGIHTAQVVRCADGRRHHPTRSPARTPTGE
jgi:hypothetical protein